MKKVLHIITRATKSGGAEKNTHYTLKALKDDYEVDLMVGGDSESFFTDLDINKVFKIDSLKRKPSFFNDIKALFVIYKMIKKKEYDLVHTHQSKAGFIGRLAAFFARTDLIVHTVHGPLFWNEQSFLKFNFYKLLEKISSFYTDWFVSVGENLRDYYLKHGIGKKEQYSIIRSGMNLDNFYNARKLKEEEKQNVKKDLGVPLDKKIVGMVGSLEKRKGFHFAIDVAKKVIKENPDTIFLFVGEGNHRKELEKKVEKENMSDNIIFTGYRNDIAKVMSVFNAFLFTSIANEGLPQVLVQSCILGLPIISFDVMGSGEMIKENGFVIKNKDIDKMAEKLSYLLSNLKKAKELGRKGRKLVDNQWKIGTMQKEVKNLYNKLFN